MAPVRISPRLMIRPRNRFLALGFALLLVAMQYGAQLHALEHIGEALREPASHSIGKIDDEPCPICALFAGGANAIHHELPAVSIVSFSEDSPPEARQPHAQQPTHFYWSQAPPALL
jgi:hypothetical protein